MTKPNQTNAMRQPNAGGRDGRPWAVAGEAAPVLRACGVGEMADRRRNSGAADTALPAPVVAVDRLSVDLAGRRVLDDVSFAAGRGELVGLLGPNGAGKTTLLRSILHLVRPAAGTVSIDGDPSRAARRLVGYVPQRHEFAWGFPISVLDAVVTGRVGRIGWLRRPARQDYEAALEALERTEMTHLRNRPVADLSGGQRQRVLVARALALRPRVLLLDEPFTGLDMPTQELLTDLFATLAGDGETLVMSTHDIAGAFAACTRLVLLNRTVVASGRPGELADPEPWRRTFEIGPASPLNAVLAALRQPTRP